MERESDLLSPTGVLASWLAALWAYPLAIVVAVVGQAVGAMLGGCTWIGVSLPVDRPVWALVNQPVLSFAASASATGYWLGSLLLPAALGALTLGFVPRPRTWSAEVGAIQLVWASIVVAVAWLPILDLAEGHVARWLHFRDLPELLVWAAPVGAGALGLLPTLRLLALERSARGSLGRTLRLLTVLVHFGVPSVTWVAGSTLIAGRIHPASTAAAAVPVLGALAVAWIGYPSPLTRRLGQIRPWNLVLGALMATALVSVLWLAGRPLSAGRCSGILWGTPTSMNNIRSWIDPMDIDDLVPGRISDAP